MTYVPYGRPWWQIPGMMGSYPCCRCNRLHTSNECPPPFTLYPGTIDQLIRDHRFWKMDKSAPSRLPDEHCDLPGCGQHVARHFYGEKAE